MAEGDWAEYEEQCGHSISRQDIFQRFTEIVTAKKQSLLAAQADRGLTPDEAEVLHNFNSLTNT